MLDGIDITVLVWLVLAALSGIGEMMSGTLFLLPIVAGAIVAAVLAALGVEMTWVLVVFALISVSALAWLRRLALQSDVEPSTVRAGATRYVDAVGVVTTDMSRLRAGRVDVEAQSWRALPVTDEPIAAGAQVQVIGVRGNALIVEQID